MKTKLLKSIRKRAFLQRRNNEYKAIIKGGMFRCWLESQWTGKESAILTLRYYILFIARYKNKKVKETIH